MQDDFLDNLLKSQVVVYCFLVNGIKLEGKINAYDQYSIMLSSTQGYAPSQLIMKSAVSTIVPQDNNAAPRKTF